MKLLVDAQLPNLLVNILEQLDLDAIHVDYLPEGDETSDTEIASYADKYGLMVVAKDSDFYHSHMTAGKPKKLFLLYHWKSKEPPTVQSL